jgi:methylenetetrahydrofolate reductase (NADPH)
MLFRRRSSLSPTQADALARVLDAPTFELVPLKNALDQAAFLPPRATVSVTASPAKGIEATVALCEQLQAGAFRAVPHLSARMIRDRAHLSDLIAWLEGAGVDRFRIDPFDRDQVHERLVYKIHTVVKLFL